MNKQIKKIYIPIFVLLIILGFYSFVFSFFNNILQNTNVNFVVNKNIYLNNKNLNKTFVVYWSDIDLSKYKLYSKCSKNSSFLKSEKNLYVFKIENFDKNCLDPNIYLQNRFWKNYKNTKIKLNLIKEEQLIAKYIDYSNSQLNDLKNDFEYKLSKITKIEPFAFNKANYIWKIYMSKRYFEKEEYKYKIKLINKILKLRKNKYIIPIEWKTLPTRKDKIPNAWRWYRSHYTDWIHHWWDIDADLWTDVLAIDNWIIVKIVDWKWEDFSKIKYWKNLTKLDKARNLNILRWKQVWLKTMKWDVVFYSHLDNIPENLKEWDFVWVWTKLWEVSITWVPDKTYNDYHLHFPIQKNPHILSKAWNYTDDDYIMWDWIVKWKTKEEVIEIQNQLFKNPQLTINNKVNTKN